MTFQEFQDRCLAANIRPYMPKQTAVALWALHTGRLNINDPTNWVDRTVDVSQAAEDLGNILRNLAAIATELGLDLQEVAEKSLKQATNGVTDNA